MIRAFLCLFLALLAGCSATRNAAPVRDARPGVAKAPTEKVPAGFYRVVAGDTLYKIAFEQGEDYRDLALWNKLADPTRILAGQLLRVKPPPVPKPTPTSPPSHSRPVAVATRPLPAEPTISSQPISGQAITPANLVLADPPEPSPDVWTWPSRGPLLSRYGEGMNKGIDIAGAQGQVVQAAAPGRVVYAGSGLRGYGKLIIIRHGKTLLSAYAHNARILVAEGQMVGRGQAIAEMGDSDADRVKLHFEIREYGKPVDPLDYLPKLS